MALHTQVKVWWSLLPANVRLFVHGLGSAAVGGAAGAAAIYFADHNHHTLQGIKEAWGVVLGGASLAVALYLKGSPIPGWKWDRAVQKGEAIERRSAPPVLPPPVIVVPETPPGDPLGKKD